MNSALVAAMCVELTKVKAASVLPPIPFDALLTGMHQLLKVLRLLVALERTN